MILLFVDCYIPPDVPIFGKFGCANWFWDEALGGSIFDLPNWCYPAYCWTYIIFSAMEAI